MNIINIEKLPDCETIFMKPFLNLLQAQVDHKIKLRIAPALTTLRK